MNGVRPEKHPAEVDSKQREHPVQRGGGLMPWQTLRQAGKLFHDDHSPVQHAPEDERPVCAVPYARQQPHKRKVEHKPPI